MKKQILAALLFCALAAQIPAQAAGGFQGPDATQVVSTAQLKSLPDDAYAIIEGSIVRNIRGDHYEFKDASGTIDVEIDHKYWNGQTITPNNIVRLTVEVDKDLMKTEYDVKKPIEILK